MADVIYVTQRPIWFPNTTGAGSLGSAVMQDLNQATDVSRYDEIDVVANVYKLSTGTLTINLYANQQKTQDDGLWQSGKLSLGALTPATAEGIVTASFSLVNARYVRWQLSPSTTMAVAVDLVYFGRRKGS
jgi:hypothetical protein